MNKYLVLVILLTLFSCSKEDEKTNTPVSNPIIPPSSVYIISVVATPTTAESITLKNNSGSSADIGGWTLGDKNDPTAYNIPQNTMMANGSTLLFIHTTLGFQINDQNEDLFLKNSSGNTIHTWMN